jgi:hypothetical protein
MKITSSRITIVSIPIFGLLFRKLLALDTPAMNKEDFPSGCVKKRHTIMLPITSFHPLPDFPSTFIIDLLTHTIHCEPQRELVCMAKQVL